MAIFKFRAVSAQSGLPLRVEIFMSNKQGNTPSDPEDKYHGFTPADAKQYLEFTTEGDSELLSWYAMIWNSRIASGEGLGGTFEILVDEKENTVETVAKLHS